MLTKRLVAALVCATALLGGLTATASADFPYRPAGGPAGDFSAYHVNQGQTPNDLDAHDNVWHFASTPENSTDPGTLAVNGDPRELNGVRGSHLADANASAHAGWEVTTGRPDVAIAVLDSGIKWNDAGAMNDLRSKVRLNRGELPVPRFSGPSLDASVNCASYSANSGDAYDVNHDSVFNLMDYACDPRVHKNDHHEGPPGVLTPQDLIVAFSDGTDADGNGFVDDIAGWDFLDNDNDPYDDVQYGHGTGEARDSTSEANNGGQAGTCPNCMVVPLRVGDSFVADVNNFAQAAIYATDNNVLVIQEALGTLNNSHLARRAVDYAWEHGVTIIASAADESAQHHNWPSTYDHTLVVNSVTQYATQDVPDPSHPGQNMTVPVTPSRKSYLNFNGCTNFSTRVTLAIPSTSCSSDATGQAAGMAGLIYSAAMNAHAAGHLASRGDCQLTNGDPCLITPNEVRQLMATGSVSSVDASARANSPDTTGQADDVNFFSGADAFSCAAPAPGCTDPNALFGPADSGRPYAEATFHSYPARKGYDEFYGFGRVNMVKALDATGAGLVPPEAEIDSPGWYDMIDPARATLDVAGRVDARGQDYTCVLEAAPGSEPNNADVSAGGDFKPVNSGWCDGTTHHSAAHTGFLGAIDLADLKTRFPASTDFSGPAPPPQSNAAGGGTHFNNRPAQEPYGFTLRVVVTSHSGPVTLTGQDRQNEYLHHDADLLPGFPMHFPSDGASSPALADLDGDNKNELVFGTSDGRVHAMRPDGSELPGWPVHVDPLPLHTGGRAFKQGDVPEDSSYAAILASPAVGDIDHDGVPEVVVADLEGKVTVFGADGQRKLQLEADPKFSGKPLQPFENVRRGKRYRTQHGFIASPVLADLDRAPDGHLEIVAAGLDRHVYAWRADGTQMPGFPVLVIDRSKISAIDPTTHAPTFVDNTDDDDVNQGAIVDTPAVGNIAGDAKPEIVVGTNEEYRSSRDGGLNAGNVNTGSFTALGLALSTSNTRLFAFPSTGEPGGPKAGSSPFLPGWPVKMAQLQPELLPLVGEGVTGSPVIGAVTCQTGGSGQKVGAISDAGPAYIWNPNGTSCYGQSGGHDNALQTDFAAGTVNYDHPAVPAVGHPAFADLDGTGTSLISPAAGVIRSLDVVLPEYQGGQDFIAAWNGASGQYRPGFPSPVNDLQFLTGPSAADIDGAPGEEILGGTATLDLNALNAAGTSAMPAKWPKFTADWMVANPLVGTFGALETDSATHKVVIAMTRAGNLFAYSTSAPACAEAQWPRFHHDNANSGVLDRDAVAPGTVTNAKVTGNALTFTAPGDDLLCGTVDHYEVVTSDVPIHGGDFGSAAQLKPTSPAAPGASQTLNLGFALRRYVAVRAVDDQNNAGRPALVDRGAPQNSGNNGGGGGNNGGGGGNGNGDGGNPPGSSCKDKLAPLSTISRRALHRSRHGISARGHSRDRGCAGLKRIDVQIAKLVRGKKCRFLKRNGKLTKRRSCRRPVLIHARGKRAWRLHVKGRLAPGRYLLAVQAIDRKGHRERPRKGNTMRFRIR